MNTALWVGAVLAGAALLGSWRVWRAAPRRRGALLAGQWLAAGALYFFLFPPESPVGTELVVLTRGATAAQRDALPAGADVAVLPEACPTGGTCAPTRGALPFPDLATALRARPGTSSLRVVGEGLSARDRDAARGIALRFDPAPTAPGIVALQLPPAVAAGSRWTLSGSVNAPAGARLELRDPGDTAIATMTPDRDGAFRFDAPSRLPGDALFRLRLLDAAGTVLDELLVPLAAEAAAPVRALLLAGAPDPELKYLRRWALDAGIALDARIGISPETAAGAALAPRDAAAFSEFALAIVDERAWSSLAPEQRQALTQALEGGLGLLLRVTGPMPKAVGDDWRALGFDLTEAKVAQGVTLARTLGLDPTFGTFARLPLQVRATDASPLLRDDAGEPLALMRAQGRGRVALWWLQDSFRLALAGEAERHATLWSRVFATLGRAGDATPLEGPGLAWTGERAVLCGLSDDARVQPPAGAAVPLLVDPASGARRCGAYWPAQPGWQELSAGERRARFHVYDRNQGRALAAASARAATAQLAALQPVPAASAVAIWSARWIAGLLALATLGAIWWLERRATRA